MSPVTLPYKPVKDYGSSFCNRRPECWSAALKRSSLLTPNSGCVKIPDSKSRYDVWSPKRPVRCLSQFMKTILTLKTSLTSVPRWLKWKWRSEEHTSELQSHHDLVCRLL